MRGAFLTDTIDARLAVAGASSGDAIAGDSAGKEGA
jgi:hypothetical protein